MTALAGALLLLGSRYNTTAVAARELDRVVGAADGALESYRQAVEKAKNASASERAELDAKAAALRRVTLARINDAKVAAQQQIDEAVAARQRADTAIERAGATRQGGLAALNDPPCDPVFMVDQLAADAIHEAQNLVAVQNDLHGVAHVAVAPYAADVTRAGLGPRRSPPRTPPICAARASRSTRRRSMPPTSSARSLPPR